MRFDWGMIIFLFLFSLLSIEANSSGSFVSLILNIVNKVWYTISCLTVNQFSWSYISHLFLLWCDLVITLATLFWITCSSCNSVSPQPPKSGRQYTKTLWNHPSDIILNCSNGSTPLRLYTPANLFFKLSFNFDIWLDHLRLLWTRQPRIFHSVIHFPSVVPHP